MLGGTLAFAIACSGLAAANEPSHAAAGIEESDGPELKSAAAIVIEQGGGQVFYAKNIESIVPIASTTLRCTRRRRSSNGTRRFPLACSVSADRSSA